MLGFGGIVRHNPPIIERPKLLQTASSMSLANAPIQTPSLLTQEEDQFGNANTRSGYSENKVLPSEINADILRITTPGTPGNFLVDSNSALIAKIYFQKKQFIWEYTDNSNNEDKQKKRRIEMKFGDITNISVNAKEGQTGNIIITTNKPVSLYKEKQNAPGKNTQWDKAEDFTGGFDKPKDSGVLKIETQFAKDALNKPSNKITHLSKLLSSDGKIRQMIENNPESCFDQVKDINDHSEEESIQSEMKLNDKGLSLSELGINQEFISKSYLDEMMSKPIEDLVEIVTKELKPRYQSSFKKYRFLCPACKGSKFNSDSSLREHLHKKHKNLVDLGLEVLQNGHFRASPLFMVNVLALAKAKPQLMRTIMKNAMMFDYDN
ncbi:hypothetical protein SteCoe_10306 [Stentor coeruleus]|uniref:TRF2/HOY1 PH-like domain-containing protein n=1 Tax=Stentor coeruleus TaxID=5963 RepID=A0A1R2CFW0_9CILI|nr:hypothetical protein SteCoe_10306 [Stentor coeruleus]